MSKVVVLDASSPSGTTKSDLNAKRFEIWVPVYYIVEDLKRDVARYWHLNESNFELHDENGDVLSGYSPVASSVTPHPSTLTLHRVESRSAARSTSSANRMSRSLTDQFTLRDRVFDLFALSALQNPVRKGQLVLTKQQFKQLLRRAVVHPMTRKLEFETSIELAMKRCASLTRDGEAPATIGFITFDGFLDVLIVVAVRLFPKARSEEVAFEQLLHQHLIPFYHNEQQIGNGCPNWVDISALMTGTSVDEISLRFAKPLSDLAETYCTSLSSITRVKSLTFCEFRRFICDVKSKELHITPAELSKIFLHFFWLGESSRDEGIAAPSVVDRVGTSDARHDDRESSLALLCKGILGPLGAIAWLSMARLVKNNNLPLLTSQSSDGSAPKVCQPSEKMRARVLKALLHHIALHLRDRNTVMTVNTAAHAVARQRFLLEFERMHREDSLEDYQHEFTLSIQRQQPKQEHMNERKNCKKDGTISSSPLSAITADGPSEAHDELSFLNDPSRIFDEPRPADCERTALETSTAAQGASSEYTRDEPQPAFRLHDALGACNEADEMYTLLTIELLQHSAEKHKLDGARVIESILDAWTAAGERYSQVIGHLQDLSTSHCQADTFARWGISLEVFAFQVLKHTTTVYEYKALFGVTNPRIYSVASDMWRDISSLFSADLAMESLSLASAKLSRAAEEFRALLGGDEYSAPDPAVSSSDDDEERSCDSSDGSSDEDDGECECRGSSALYEKYLNCLFHRANCLLLYGDILAHGKAVQVDYQLGCELEVENDSITSTKEASALPSVFYNSSEVLAKSSSCGAFYNEARKMYTFLIDRSITNSRNGGGEPKYSVTRLHRNIAAVQFKLAALVPRGCVVESLLLDAALTNALTARNRSEKRGESYSSGEDHVINYIRAITTVRQSFFQPDANSSGQVNSPSDDALSSRRSEDRIVPFYRFILAATFRDLDSESIGKLGTAQLVVFNRLVKHGGEISDSTMRWLVASFDSESNALTERGFLSYFCWLAEADPITFTEILERLTSKYTDTHQFAVSPSTHTHPRTLQRPTRLRSESSLDSAVHSIRASSDCALQSPSSSIAESVIVLSGKLHHDALSDLCNTKSPSEIRLEPEVVETLPPGAPLPEELSKFCFPDTLFLSSEWTPPRHFDVVLTGIKGSMLYASCLHFVEERDPMEVLALISSVDQHGGKTVDLPTWISLKDIQQGRSKWRCFLPVCVCVLSSVPLFKTFRKFLVHTYQLLSSQAEETEVYRATPEALAFNLLQQIRMPIDPGSQTAFKFGDQLCLVPTLTPGSPLFYPTEVDFSILFQCLSPDNIVKIYGFLLTEKKVVLCARNKAVLTHVAETFRALLHPFEFQHVYIPLLPISLLDFAMAPVPFFMGIGSDVGVTNLGSEGIVVVDLDTNDVRVPMSEPMPMISDAKTKKIVNALRKIMTSTSASTQPGGIQFSQFQLQSQHPLGQSAYKDTFGSFQDSQLRSLPSDYSLSQATDSEVMSLIQAHDELTDKWTEIQGAFTSFATRLIKDVRKFCSRSALSLRDRRRADSGSHSEASGLSTNVDFDKRGFLAIHPGMRDFCSHFFQTQIFQRFLDNFDTVTSQLHLPDANQTKRGMRSISSLRKHLSDSNGSATDDPIAKQQLQSVARAPLPPLRSPKLDIGRPADGRHFDAARYEALLVGNRAHIPFARSNSSTFPLRASPPRMVSASSIYGSSVDLTDSFLGPEDASPSNLVNEARRRITEKLTQPSGTTTTDSDSKRAGG